ncbi:MAG: hemolysin III family protein, partial [Thermoanaerobaculia bacterium]|nr:hemolysin III family protein [Thermoanaerobaculia bacterium]
MKRPLAPAYSVAEEIAHAITHGLGLVMSIAGLVVLVWLAARYGSAWHVVGCAIFGATLILTYTASTLYHSLPARRVKSVFQKLDHSAIFLLIAGTYTPFTLVNLRGPWGWSILATVWAVGIFGIAL